MTCPHCKGEDTEPIGINNQQKHIYLVVYFCNGCAKTFEVDDEKEK